MTIFSLLILVYIGYVFLACRNTDKAILHIVAFDMVLHLCVDIGYFIRTGYDIDFCYFVDGVILAWGFSRLVTPGKFDRSTTQKYGFYVLSMLIGMFMLMFFPYDKPIIANGVSWEEYLKGRTSLRAAAFTANSVIHIFKFLVVVTCIFFIKTFIKFQMWNYILQKIYGWIRIILVLGIVEAVTRYVFESDLFNRITIAVFGITSSTYDTIVARGSGFMLQGLNREASHFVYALAVICIFLYVYKRSNTKAKRWLYVALILMLASMAITSVYCLFILFGMKLSYDIYLGKLNTKKVKKVLFYMGIGTVGLMVLMAIRLESSMVDYILVRTKDAYVTFKMILFGDWRTYTGYFGSNQIRLISMWETFKLSWHRAFFGFGVGSISAHSPLMVLLAEMGYIGALAGYRFFFDTSIFGLEQKKKKMVRRIIVGYLAMNLLAGIERLSFSMISLLILMISIKAVDARGTYENNDNNTSV